MDYSKGKIYRIINSDLVQYYGSTIQDLKARFSNHKRDFISWCKDNTKPYCSSYEVFKGSNVEIELVYDCPCVSKEELLKCEQVFISNDNCVNKNSSFLTLEERNNLKKNYYHTNKDKYLENTKKYRKVNRDKYLESKKKYYQANRDKQLEYQKEYAQINKEMISQRNKKRYQSRKEKII